MIFNKISSIWDEASWKVDSFSTSSLYKINTISTSYGSLSVGDYKDYYEIAPGIGTFQLVVTTEGMNSLYNTTYNYSFEIKIVDSLGRQVFASDIVGPDIYSDSITFTSINYSTYYVEINNSSFGNFQYAATLNSVSSGGGGASDTTAPSLSTVSPIDGASGVAVNANFVLTFNEAVKAGTGSFVVKNGSTTVATIAVTDTSQVTFSGSTVTINPNSNLNYDTNYSVEVALGVIKDSAGNNWGGTSNYFYDFKTELITAPVVTVGFTKNFFNIVEGNSGSKLAQPIIELSSASTTPITVSYTTTLKSYGSATANNDFTPITGSITFAPGEISKSISIPIIGDSLYEANENFYVDITGAVGATVVTNTAEGLRNSWVSITITNDDVAINTIPTLTSFVTSVKTSNEDAEATILLRDLLAAGNEADADGSVTSFVVKTVSSGTLKIGMSTGSATAWNPTTNNTIDATKSAFWTPAANANGTLNAFTAVAKDNSGAESATAVQAKVAVTAVNDAPKLTAFSTAVKSSTKNAAATISLSDLQAAGNEADTDGTVNSFVVKTVSTGTLKIGTTAATATAWSSTNNTVDSTKSAFWTPATNATGSLNAFTVVAKDNGGLESSSPVQAVVSVGATLDTKAPTVSTFSPADGATGVAVGSNIVLTFSEAIQKGTGIIYLRTGSATGTVVEQFDAASSTSIAISGSTLTIDPSSNLANNNSYFVTFASGTVKDFAGNNYAGITSYDFKTVAANTSSTLAYIGTESINRLVANNEFPYTKIVYMYGYGGNDTLKGAFLHSNFIYGGSGDDQLDGGATENVIFGEDGNDTINAWQGGYSELFGGAGNDVIVGGNEGNLIDGGAGTDQLTGGDGADVYVIDTSTDQISETYVPFYDNDPNPADLVSSSVSWVLGTNLENLTLTGTDTINGTGNTLDNILTGNYAANTLNGGAGNDTLNGGLGNDILTGGTGSDYFDFTSVLNGNTNVDTITDFNTADDFIRLDNAVMAGLATRTGALSETAFVSGAGRTAAADTLDRIIYNKSTGDLYYDADGTGNSVAIKIALIGTSSSRPALDHTDFLII